MKKILTVFAIFSVLTASSLSLFTTKAHAQNDIGPWYNQTYNQWFVKVYGGSNPQEIFGERYTAAQVQWIIYSILAYFDPNKNTSACLQAGDINACVDGFRNFIFPVASAPYTPSIADHFSDSYLTLGSILQENRPVSGIGYVKNAIERVGPEDVYAQDTQGTGFRGLTSVQTLWQATRDVSYLFMIFVIIAMAFMVMFRAQLPSRTVITVQSSLLKVFVTLILITFSYAIAGFMIDLMYLSLGVVSLIFTQSNILTGGSGATPAAIQVYGVLVNGPNNLGATGYMLSYFVSFITTFLSIFVLPNSLTDGLVTIAAAWFRGPFTVIVLLVVTIILIWIYFRIMWMLIKTFVSILLLTIFAPFQILLGAVYPGAGGFGGWMKSYLSHLAVFPVVGVLFIMAQVFLAGAFLTDADAGPLGSILRAIAGSEFVTSISFSINGFIVNSSLFGTTGAGSWSPPLTFGGFMPILWLFASFTCLSMVPKSVELIQSMIAGKGFDVRSSAFEGLGPVAGAGAMGVAAGKAGIQGGFVGGLQAGWASRGSSRQSMLRNIYSGVTGGAKESIQNTFRTK